MEISDLSVRLAVAEEDDPITLSQAEVAEIIRLWGRANNPAWWHDKQVALAGLLIIAGIMLSVFAGLDVDNAWTGIGALVGGIGIGKLG